jgi:hypothetical protein
VPETNKSGIAERVSSTSGSVLTWVFGLLLLASVMLPMTAASAHHHAVSSSKVDASGDVALSGLRTFIHASLRANVRPTRPEAAPGWDKDGTSGESFELPTRASSSIGPAAMAVSVPKARASAFLARGPPVKA